MTYKTPGVYVKEISIFPPSVAEVETAIPAFIGYTEKADKKGVDLTNTPTKIKSLLEYVEYFGAGASPNEIEVQLDAANSPKKVTISPRYLLYQSVRMFYDNGGGDCYIVSVGDYETNNTIQNGDLVTPGSYGFLFGLKALEKEDEPTLILFPDAVLLSSESNLYSLQQAALEQCNKLQDRFAIFDLLESRASDVNFTWSSGVDEFRDNIGVSNLKYGAAYVPHIKSTIPYNFKFGDITTLLKGGSPVNLEDLTPLSATLIGDLNNATADLNTLYDFINKYNGPDPILEQYDNLGGTGKTFITNRVTFINGLAKDVFDMAALTNSKVNTALTGIRAPGTNPNFGSLETIVRTLLQYDLDYYDGAVTSPTPNALSLVDPGTDFIGYVMTGIVVQPAASSIYTSAGLPGSTVAAKAKNASGPLRVLFEKLLGLVTSVYEAAVKETTNREKELKESNSVYANIVEAIKTEGSTVPPSGPIVGIYSYVDSNRGVWKSPANVNLRSVKGVTATIDHFDQEDLNIDVNAGKSINAIRPFTGKGVLVWGARTLAGNDNEWRYISVRRFFNMVEESVKKSTGWAVFEPNDANTWNKVQGMIENYLYKKWQEGALQGAKPDDAYFVKVGLGLTMTAQDILEGRMIVEIGMAVVRPAEFIILKFSHKMIES